MAPRNAVTKPKKKKRRKQQPPAVRGDRNTAFERLKNLPNFDLVHQKICAAVSCEEVARWLQEDCDLCHDVKRTGLVRQLYRYKRSLKPGEVDPRQTSLVARKVEQFKHEVNTLEELVRLFEFQTTRINKLAEREETTPLIIPTLGKEIDRGADLLNQIARLKGELGLLDKQHGERSFYGQHAEFGEGFATGALAVIRQTYGAEATTKLVAAGKKLAEAIRKVKPGDAPRPVLTKGAVEVHTVEGETDEQPTD